MLNWKNGNPKEEESDSIQQIYHRSLHGITIHSALNTQQCEQLLNCPAQMQAYPFHPDFPSMRSYGRLIAPTMEFPKGPNLEDYFVDAQQNFSVLSFVIPWLQLLLTRQCAGLPVSVFNKPKQHNIGTFRVFPDGFGAPKHNDTYGPYPSFAHLHQYTDRSVQLSWYILLQKPVRGGVLALSSQHRTERSKQAQKEIEISLSVGDMVVFDGSNYAHQITPGEGTRITFGGFAALDPHHQHLYFWS